MNLRVMGCAVFVLFVVALLVFSVYRMGVSMNLIG